MKHFRTFEAKDRLSALLDPVEAGGEVAIPRNGKPLAPRVPAPTPRDVEKAQAAVAAIRGLRTSVKPGPHGLAIRDHAEMGRRF